MKFPRMILIGSLGRNAGKTALAAALIRRFRSAVPVYGLKVTSADAPGAVCRLGRAGCGACGEVPGEFLLTEELRTDTEKDTAVMLRAGARRVYWLRARRSFLALGFQEAAHDMPPDALVICESNSLRQAVTPGLFVMVRGGDGEVKPGALAALPLADAVYDNDFTAPVEAFAERFALLPGGKPALRTRR